MSIHNKLSLFIFTSIILPLSSVYAQDLPVIYKNAHHMGRASTGIASSSANTEGDIFYNPAFVAYGEGVYKRTILLSPMIEVSKSANDLYRKVSAEGESAMNALVSSEGKPQSVGVNQYTGLLLRRAAIGGFASSSNTAMLYKDPNAGGLESVMFKSTSYGGAHYSMAQDFFDKKFMVGFTAFYLKKAATDINISSSELEDSEGKNISLDDKLEVGSGIGGNLGFYWASFFEQRKFGKANFGLTINDVGDTRFKSDNSEKPLKYMENNRQTVNLGLSFEPKSLASQSKILFDYRDVLNNYKDVSTFKKIFIGAELNVKDHIGLTAGLYKGYPSFGFYLDAWLARLDLGMYSEEIGEKVGQRTDTRYFLKLSLGI